VPYLGAKGSWRGGDLATKINTVDISCYASEGHYEMHQANVLLLDRVQWLSLYNDTFRITKLDGCPTRFSRA
jgi:hypothetical protein